MKSKPTNMALLQKQFFDSHQSKTSKNTIVRQFFFDKGSVAKGVFSYGEEKQPVKHYIDLGDDS
jgi:hypothetical protein